MKMYYAVKCLGCGHTKPLLFEDEGKRDEWAKTHATATRHAIQLGVDYQ